ncbi:hypothetical protein DY000_02035445 [Brassica cretica]|uniref:Uncharacterized protein n=1 Tax=Brassica cretica TaxID=69181 RepID=A0ABQ7DYH8_BRACR|nr:hypothetical protein DY000_02035445 [Brassica cretica]
MALASGRHGARQHSTTSSPGVATRHFKPRSLIAGCWACHADVKANSFEKSKKSIVLADDSDDDEYASEKYSEHIELSSILDKLSLGPEKKKKKLLILSPNGLTSIPSPCAKFA